MAKVWFKNLIHESLKGNRGITETKWHYPISKRSPWRSECCLQLIFLGDADLVVATIPIAKAIPLMACYFVHDLINEWNGIVVPPHSCIQLLIVDADTELAILLLCHHNG